jgi:hypothetical protein
MNGRRYRSREPMLVTEEVEGPALGEVHRCITQERVRQDPLVRAPGEGARKDVGRQRDT